jgi:hypothetical protein
VNALILGQWAPLLLTVALLPALLPLTLVKPHVGLPIAIAHLNGRRALACALFAVVSLVADPSWPWLWLQTSGAAGFVAAQTAAGGYNGFIPLLTAPGIALLVMLWWSRGREWWRCEDIRYLLLCACAPQQPYDSLILIAALRSSSEMVYWTACSLVSFILATYCWSPASMTPFRRAGESAVVGGPLAWISVALSYLPVAAMVLARSSGREQPPRGQ